MECAPSVCKQVRYLPPGYVPTPAIHGTHSAAQPHTIEHASCGQPFPTTPADCVGRGIKHTSCKNSRLFTSRYNQQSTIVGRTGTDRSHTTC